MSMAKNRGDRHHDKTPFLHNPRNVIGSRQTTKLLQQGPKSIHRLCRQMSRQRDTPAPLRLPCRVILTSVNAIAVPGSVPECPAFSTILKLSLSP